VSRIARAADTGATLPGRDNAQMACRPSSLAAVKSTPAGEKIRQGKWYIGQNS